MTHQSFSDLVFPLIPRRKITGLGFGSWPTIRKGAGSDFAGSRPYVPGDDLRQINHKASARFSAMRGRQEFVVSEYFADATAQVIIIVDRAPTMQRFPDFTKFLNKPQVITNAGALIVDSAVRLKCVVGYLDFADWGRAHKEDDKKAFWRSPRTKYLPRVKERNLPHPYFTAPVHNVTMAIEFLFGVRKSIQSESFVFIISDFMTMPPRELLAKALMHLDIVPVLVQDPRVEMSFPLLDNVMPVALPIGDNASRGAFVPLTRTDAKRMRQENERRFERILSAWRYFGLEPVVLDTTDPFEIQARFARWMEKRKVSRR